MKNYIGVKVVKAEIGTKAEADLMKTGVSLKIARAMAKPKTGSDQEGYIVVYPDGYVSWSPKRVFEEHYRELNCLEFINDPI